MKISSLRIYPVKSLRGIDLSEAEVRPRGFRHDRRWMLVDPAGRFITQREQPQLATIATELTPTGLLLSSQSSEMLVPFTATGSEIQVNVWRDEVTGRLVSDEADTWLQAELGLECRLVKMPPEARRAVAPEYGQPGDVTSFSDGFPYLIIGQSSLDELNLRLDEELPMNRFRTNIVVEGSEPFAEDAWKRIRVGEVEFDVVKPCSRCVMTTTDQFTGERRGLEPLKTLAQFRLQAGKVMFGQNAIARGTGVVRVGDTVSVLD